MLRAEREVVKREDAFTANEIEFRRLEQLHSQLESFLLQATLITGFAIGTLNADNLVAIVDDVGKFWCAPHLYPAPLACQHLPCGVFAASTSSL